MPDKRQKSPLFNLGPCCGAKESGGLFLSKVHPENETGAPDSEPELSRLGAIGLVAVLLLLIALMGGLLYASKGWL
jgi:hypothetical protein